jgi:hypothetical protein
MSIGADQKKPRHKPGETGEGVSVAGEQRNPWVYSIAERMPVQKMSQKQELAIYPGT